MTIIVDAYNFIKHISKSTFVSDQKKQSWIDRFCEYVEFRNNEVILVFDAGPGLYKTVERHRHITVIYSGQMDSADDVIKQWLRQRTGQNILLVTSDREVREAAHACNIVSIGSDEFYEVFNEVMDRHVVYEQKVSKIVHKISSDYVEGLDDLMEAGSRHLVQHEDESGGVQDFRVRNGKKASKQNKKLLKKIEKI